MTTCPKCAWVGADDEQCAKCGIIFERMHTVMEMEPAGSLAQAARQAREVARTLGVQRDDPASAPTVEVSTVDVSRSEPTPGPRVPPTVEIIERSPPTRRPWLLAGLLLAMVLLLLDQLQDRKAEERLRREAAAAAAVPPMDAAYLDLALESMLAQARAELRRIDDPATAQVRLQRLLARVNDLDKRLGRASIPEANRADYGASLAALRGFLESDVSDAIAAATVAGARAEPVSIQALERAEAAFARARSH